MSDAGRDQRAKKKHERLNGRDWTTQTANGGLVRTRKHERLAAETAADKDARLQQISAFPTNQKISS